MVKEAEKKLNEFIGKVNGVGTFIKNLAEVIIFKFFIELLIIQQIRTSQKNSRTKPKLTILTQLN